MHDGHGFQCGNQINNYLGILIICSYILYWCLAITNSLWWSGLHHTKTSKQANIRHPRARQYAVKLFNNWWQQHDDRPLCNTRWKCYMKRHSHGHRFLILPSKYRREQTCLFLTTTQILNLRISFQCLLLLDQPTFCPYSWLFYMWLRSVQKTEMFLLVAEWCGSLYWDGARCLRCRAARQSQAGLPWNGRWCWGGEVCRKPVVEPSRSTWAPVAECLEASE